MKKLQYKAFFYQFACFAVLFIGFRYLIEFFTNLTGIWIPLTAFVVATLVSPKFHAMKTKNGDKLFMKWIFVKGVKEIE